MAWPAGGLSPKRGRTNEGVPLRSRDHEAQDRSPPLPHGGACPSDRRHHPAVVPQRTPMGLVGTEPRLSLPAVRMVRGGAAPLPCPTLNPTQRAFLSHGTPPGACCQRPGLCPASQHVREGEEKGGQRAEGGNPSQVVPAVPVPSGDTGFDSIQPRGLCPVCGHRGPEGRGARGER